MFHFHVVFYTEDFLQRGSSVPIRLLSPEYCIICIPRITTKMCANEADDTLKLVFKLVGVWRWR